MKKKNAEINELAQLDVLQEQLEVYAPSISTALANAMLDASHIEMSQDNSGNTTVVNVAASFGLSGASAGIQIQRRKVINNTIIINTLKGGGL